MKRKWMCPCHADWEMPKKRHKKSVIEVDIENLTEADFDSIEEFEAGRIDNDEDYNENSKNNIPSNQQQLSSDHTNTKDTNSKENNEVVKIKNENEINEVKRENSEEPYKPDKLHYSDNVKEIKKEINPLYVELGIYFISICFYFIFFFFFFFFFLLYLLFIIYYLLYVNMFINNNNIINIFIR